jgi:hypothetical protein
VVEGGIQMEDTSSFRYLWFSNEQALPAMIVGTLVDPMATLLNANGDVVSAMLITRISEGEEVAFKHVDYNLSS